MKKCISLILTVAILLSMTTFVAPVSAETEVNDLFMTDASREAFLNSKRSQPVELYLFQDIFATFEERQKNADWYSWSVGDISTIWPYKGIGTGIEPKYPAVRSGIQYDFAMMIDLGSGASTYADGMDLKSNPLVSFDEESQRYFVDADGVTYKLGEIAEGKKGGNFATFGVKYDIQSNNIADGIGIKEQILNTDVYPNIGTSKQIQKAIYPVNRAGVAELNILLTSPAMNDKTRSARVPCTIRYADGTEEKIALIVASINADGQGSIVAVPKQYTTYTELAANDVEARSVVGKDITNEELTIPSIGEKNYIAEKSFVLATFMRNYKGGELAGYVHSFSIPVDPAKTIQSVTFEKNSAAIIGHYSENVPSKTTSTDMYTFVPVTIEGAPTDTYNYYLHVTRSCGSSGIFAMSTSYETYQSKIDAIEARIAALDEPYNTAQKMEIAEIKNAIQSLESEGVLELDYDQALITKLVELYQSAEAEIKAAQIAAVEEKITDMAFNYESSMRTEVEGIKAEYDALLSSGISSSEFNQDLLAKFGAVYEVYEVSSAVEDKVAGWGNEYLYTMYNEVRSAKTTLDEVVENPAAAEDAIDGNVVAKINKMNTLALKASAIDDKISVLDVVYNVEQLEMLIEVKADIDAFKAIGGTEKGLAKADIFNSLYAAAFNDLLQRDIDNVVAKIEALPEFYSSTLDEKIAEIDEAVALIEERGGVIPSTASAKLTSIKEQRDETPYYTTFELPYNRDVFESVGRYQAQYKDKNGNYVKNDAGHFEPQVENPWTFAAFIYYELTLDEDRFSDKLGVDLSTNKATVKGIPYQFGKIKSEPDGVINESNAISSTTAKSAVIDVPNNVYSKIHAAMWAYNDADGVTITYKYADGSSSTEANVTKVAGGRSSVSSLTSSKSSVYKVMNNDAKASVFLYRAYNPRYDTGAPGGGYTIAIVEHILTPDDQKILDKIEITFATTGANLFAMTGQVGNSEMLKKHMTEVLENTENMDTFELEAAVETCKNIINALSAKNVAYDSSWNDVIPKLEEKIKQKYINEFEERIKGFPDKYVYNIANGLNRAKEYYEMLVEKGDLIERIDETLLNKYFALWDEYVKYSELEDQISPLVDKYEYSMYEQVVLIKEKIDSCPENTLSPTIVEKFNKIYSWAVRARQIDEEIEKLPGNYTEEYKEKILELTELLQQLYDEGCEGAAIQHRGKLRKLYVETRVCGENVTWSLSEEGVLTISGTGPMKNFRYLQDVPWFEMKDSIISVEVEEGVTSVGKIAFYECANLEEVNLADTVETIGASAFFKCGMLMDINLGNGVKKIEDGAFYECSMLAKITLPDGLTEIGRHAFDKCSRLIRITLPEGVESIGEYAFENCTYLKSVSLPESLTSIGMCAFYKCSALKEIVIPEGIKVIGEATFYECTALEKVVLPASLESIEGHAFNRCGKLSEIVIPDGVKNIGNYAFYSCTELKNLTMSRIIETIGSGAFNVCDKLTKVIYKNSEKDWNQISISSGNGSLQSAEKVFIKNILPKLTVSDLTTIVSAKLYNTDKEQGVMFVVGSNKGKTEKIKNSIVTTETEETVDMQGSYDEIKVFAWESLANLKPLCEPQNVK